ncbi:MAG: hypothetical protein KAY37_14070 [Phycisphaerae bacterium]|nr:hypothetical protein [Phycisphaerae bacterium]
MNAETSHSRFAGWRTDAVILLVILAGWLVFVAVVTDGHRVILYDTFRDMAWAHNMLAGRFWADPTVPEQPFWYAPGSPLLVAGLAAVTRVSVVDLYGYSVYWFNAWLPIMLYLLARVVWDRLTAVVVLPVVFLGSYTWLTHVMAPIPGLQGVVLNLVGLLCWNQCAVTTGPARRDHRRRVAWLWPPLTGLSLALSAWYHPLCAIILAGAIFLHAVFEAVIPAGGVRVPGEARRSRFTLLGRMLVVAAVAGGLSASLALHMLALHAGGSSLLSFFADESMYPTYYAHAQTPLVVPLALLGVWFIVRRSPHAFWIVAYLLVGLAGQGAAFLAQVPGGKVPFILPHEFLWHGQLAVGVCAAVGIVGLARRSVEHLNRPRAGKPARVFWAALFVVLAVGPGLRGLPRAGKYLVDLEPMLAERREVCEWIRTHTDLEATFVADPEVGYQIVAGLTGRKCIVAVHFHTNPGVDVPGRASDVSTMLETADEQTFARLAGHYGGTHFLLLGDSDVVQAAHGRYGEWSCLERLFAARAGTAVIYRIRPPNALDAGQVEEREGAEGS